MLDYIKILIIAIFTGVTAPLPTSSSAHFSVISTILGFSSDGKLLGFYYSAFMLMFSVVVFVSLRKIYSKTLKSFFSKPENKTDEAYRLRQKNIFLTILPSLILFVPVSKEELLCDYIDKFLSNGMLIACAASIIGGFFFVVAMWYTRQNNAKTKRSASTTDALRMAVYNLPAQVVPGLSKVSLSAVNLLINDIDSKVIMREVYMYLAPQVFIFNLVKLIRSVVSGVVFDPLVLIIGLVCVAVMSGLMVSLAGKVNMRKLFGFFSIYSVVFGIFIGVIFVII